MEETYRFECTVCGWMIYPLRSMVVDAQGNLLQVKGFSCASEICKKDTRLFARRDTPPPYPPQEDVRSKYLV